MPGSRSVLLPEQFRVGPIVASRALPGSVVRGGAAVHFPLRHAAKSVPGAAGAHDHAQGRTVPRQQIELWGNRRNIRRGRAFAGSRLGGCAPESHVESTAGTSYEGGTGAVLLAAGLAEPPR